MKIGCFYLKLLGIRFILAILLMASMSNHIMAEKRIVEHDADHFNYWPRATDEELEQLRGGFILSNGVRIDLSLEKLVFLNDQAMHSSFFQLPKDGFLLQNGAENVVSDVVTPSLSSVIQNSLDDQVIRTVTEINIEVSNLQNLDLNNNSRVFTDFVVPGLQY